MVTAGTPAARLSAWLLAGKLNRRTPEEVATSLATACLTRALAAACAFGSMVLIAWIAALARAVFRHGWSSTALNATSLARASIQAGHVEGDLVPVLGVWAALLLLTPTGYTIAFRCAAVAAGALGALDFSPPSFAVTPEAAGFARDLAQFTRSWNAALLLTLTMTAAYLLHRGALGVFISLSEFSVRRTLRPARTVRFAVAFVVLLSAAWTGTVVWLAASQPGTASLGVRGGIVLSDYLVALGVVAVLVAGSAHAQGRLLASMPVAAVLGAVANVSPIPRDLMFSVERTGLERVGDAFGAGSWWAALFIGFPACLLGVYLMAPVRR